LADTHITDTARDIGCEISDAFDLLPVCEVAIEMTYAAQRLCYREKIKTLNQKLWHNIRDFQFEPLALN
jgi:hypothetical protein